MSDDLPPIDRLLPHRGPMCLIDAVVAWTPEGIRCRAVVRTDNPFLHGGRLDGVAHLEYLAQAAAAHVSLSDPMRRPVRGWLVAARDVVLGPEAEVPPGTFLEISVQEVARLGPFASYEGRVMTSGREVARGNVKVYRREEES